MMHVTSRRRPILSFTRNRLHINWTNSLPLLQYACNDIYIYIYIYNRMNFQRACNMQCSSWVNAYHHLLTYNKVNILKGGIPRGRCSITHSLISVYTKDRWHSDTSQRAWLHPGIMQYSYRQWHHTLEGQHGQSEADIIKHCNNIIVEHN